MPFVPHTLEDERQMLASIGAQSIEALFDEIPKNLRSGDLTKTPEGITEMELLRLMRTRAARDEVQLCFLGAGAYEHHIPSAVWDLVSRGEFMTAYTPYQAEASQGTLQLIYEFQTMMSRLMDLPVANASVYDGASALAEGILMAVRANKKVKSKRIAIAGDTHPAYIETCRAIVEKQGIELVILPFDPVTGGLSSNSLAGFSDFAALVISYPSFFGGLNDVDALTDLAHNADALVIGVVNPTAMAVLKPPGAWGAAGADIAVGEGQPLGIPMASGGPYLGLMCCRKEIVRQMPGRIIGRTIDTDGRQGFALTLQAREQHIRRAKATSNICTNQGLLVTAATIYMSLLGDEGLSAVALTSANNLRELITLVSEIPGVSVKFSTDVFHEVVLSLPVKASDVVARMADHGILPGLDLGEYYPGLAQCLLVNTTETKTRTDLEAYANTLSRVVLALTEETAC